METSRVLETPRPRLEEEAGEEVSGLNLAAIYDAHAAALYRYLLTLLCDPQEAEDAVQEIFLGVLRRAGRGPITDLRSYLFRAARNQAFLMLRRRRSREKESAAAALSWIDINETARGHREAAIDIDRAIRQLPVEQREVILLKLGEGFTFHEIAELLRIPRSTAASRCRLALARLRCLLEGGDDHD